MSACDLFGRSTVLRPYNYTSATAKNAKKNESRVPFNSYIKYNVVREATVLGNGIELPRETSAVGREGIRNPPPVNFKLFVVICVLTVEMLVSGNTWAANLVFDRYKVCREIKVQYPVPETGISPPRSTFRSRFLFARSMHNPAIRNHDESGLMRA